MECVRRIIMVRIVALALGAVLAFAVAHAAAAGKDSWETVNSKEGQFSVEMPEKPAINQSRIRKGIGGNVRTVLVGCKTEGGIYIVYSILQPTAIVKGTENTELDAER